MPHKISTNCRVIEGGTQQNNIPQKNLLETTEETSEVFTHQNSQQARAQPRLASLGSQPFQEGPDLAHYRLLSTALLLCVAVHYTESKTDLDLTKINSKSLKCVFTDLV